MTVVETPDNTREERATAGEETKLFDRAFFLQLLLWLAVLLLILSGIAIFFDTVSNPGLDSIYQTYY